MLAWILEHAGLEPGLPDRRRAAELSACPRASPTARSSSSRPTNTTPRSSTSARSSCTTVRAPRSSTTSNTITPTSFPTSPRSRRSSITSCARCRRTAASIVNGGDAALGARARARAAGARSSASGWRKSPGNGPGWTVGERWRGAARRRGARRGSQFALPGRHNAAQRARRDWPPRGMRACPCSRASRRSRAFAGVKRRMEVRGVVRGVTVYDDFAHHPTAIDASLAGAARQGRQRAHPRGARAALEHDEARRDEGGAARKPRARRSRVLLRREPRLGRGRRARAARRQGGRPSTTSTRSSTRSPREARPGDHVLVMSNGGFGGIHGKLLAALA